MKQRMKKLLFTVLILGLAAATAQTAAPANIGKWEIVPPGPIALEKMKDGSGYKPPTSYALPATGESTAMLTISGDPPKFPLPKGVVGAPGPRRIWVSFDAGADRLDELSGGLYDQEKNVSVVSGTGVWLQFQFDNDRPSKGVWMTRPNTVALSWAEWPKLAGYVAPEADNFSKSKFMDKLAKSKRLTISYNLESDIKRATFDLTGTKEVLNKIYAGEPAQF